MFSTHESRDLSGPQDSHVTQLAGVLAVTDVTSGCGKLYEPRNWNSAKSSFVHADMRCSSVVFCSVLLISAVYSCAQQNEKETVEDAVRQSIQRNQYDLANNGRDFLLKEARNASFFLLGELHGENEIPALLRDLWPQMSHDGYRYIAAELSPWAAHQLEFAPADGQPKLLSLWSKQEALFVHPKGSTEAVLWGCDMEEEQPQLLIQELAALNPSNAALARMVELSKSGYQRQMAPQLLEIMRGMGSVRDRIVNDVSLIEGIQATLKIEADRLNTNTKLPAQIRRESLMKDLFQMHYAKNKVQGSNAKVMLRFGRNHLHRGYDARGISTLGNFVAEFAFTQHKSVFNLAAFGAGGKASLAGETWDADERSDDLAFELLASLAQYPATVFDLRPLREILHRIPAENRTSRLQHLVYWADSYDAILCYKNVTPLSQ